MGIPNYRWVGPKETDREFVDTFQETPSIGMAGRDFTDFDRPGTLQNRPVRMVPSDNGEEKPKKKWKHPRSDLKGKAIRLYVKLCKTMKHTSAVREVNRQLKTSYKYDTLRKWRSEFLRNSVG